uniref:Class 1 knox protein n=1 Tax=Kalanchoe x houghtonii TaxID=291584 RepID=B1P380_9MAGN|nr:class 1 knox protein [Kalanchoe x houghtonii]
MAYHSQMSQELPLQHFGDQQLAETTSSVMQQMPQASPDASGKQQASSEQNQTGPNWLNNAILRHQQNHQYGGDNSSGFLNLHASSNPNGDRMMSAASMSHESANLGDGSRVGRNGNGEQELVVESGAVVVAGGVEGAMNWQSARLKAEVLSHPLYEQLLSAHVSCLRIATPVDQLPRIDAQLSQSQHVVSKYSGLGQGNQGLMGDDKELDQFMTNYVLLLCSFKEQLQQHVRVHAMEAVMACWEIEQSLQSLTGVAPGEGTGATMSDDEDDQVDSDANLYDGGLDGLDTMGFGPLIPTESERSLMERVRQELKHELKQGYKEKIVDIREEILRKRRAGKLPGDTTSVLKAWWQSHSKWPYPTEEDKARLVQETGLQLKQINNWFINQRKRNWHSNPSTSTVLKSKRKR